MNPPRIQIEKFAALVELNLSHFYIELNGNEWFSNKLEEMQENGLVYVSYHASASSRSHSRNVDDLIGFISFVDTLDHEGRVLYLYEIHIHPDHQHRGIGKLMIDKFHQLAREISHTKKENVNNEKDERGGQVLKGTKLTVFSENGVVGWYKRLGYLVSEDSPRDRVLRSGKVVKPDYYLLYREV